MTVYDIQIAHRRSSTVNSPSQRDAFTIFQEDLRTNFSTDTGAFQPGPPDAKISSVAVAELPLMSRVGVFGVSMGVPFWDPLRPSQVDSTFTSTLCVCVSQVLDLLFCDSLRSTAKERKGGQSRAREGESPPARTELRMSGGFNIACECCCCCQLDEMLTEFMALRLIGFFACGYLQLPRDQRVSTSGSYLLLNVPCLRNKRGLQSRFQCLPNLFADHATPSLYDS